VPERQGLSLKGWNVASLESNVVAFIVKLDSNGEVSKGADIPGITFNVRIVRKSKTFWIYLVVLPLSLQIIMAALTAFLDLSNLKGRIQIAGAMNLGMFFVQFGIDDYMPAAVLTPPYILVLGGYMFIIFLIAEFSLADMVSEAYLLSVKEKNELAGQISCKLFLWSASGGLNMPAIPRMRATHTIWHAVRRKCSTSREV